MFIQEDQLSWVQADPGIQRTILAYDEQMMMVKVVFEAGAIGAEHSHVHTQMSYVEIGSFEIRIGAEVRVLVAGDAFHVPSHVVHGARCLEAGVLIDIFHPLRKDFLTS